MNVKRIIKYFLIIGAVCFAGYLVFSLISDNIKKNNEEQAFCSAKCNYSQYSYFWEFSGGNVSKGFTTKDECLSFCIKSEEGFVMNFIGDSYASLVSSPPLSDLLKLIKK